MSTNMDSAYQVNDIQKRYEIDWISERIAEHHYQRVALQLPDYLLKDASLIVSALEANVPESCKLYLLADTSYGSCCVDEVAAEHVGAEALVHFGHACLTKNSRLPVYYVFVEQETTAQVFEQMLAYFESVLEQMDLASLKKNVILFASVQYQHLLELLLARLANSDARPFHFVIAVAAKEFHPHRPDFSNDMYFMGRSLAEHVDLSESCLFYVGPESVTMNTLLMSYKNLPTWSYDPASTTGLKQGYRVNTSLMKRYYLVEKILDAQLIGILVGTLGARNYLQALSELEALLRAAGKKSFVFSMGKLNVAKLANFLEIDAFVLLACPENSLFDCKEYLRPIVTPFELSLSLESSKNVFDSEWTSDFGQFLKEKKGNRSLKDDDLLSNEPSLALPLSNASSDMEKDDTPRYSFATGKLVSFKSHASPDNSSETHNRSPTRLIGYHDTGDTSAIGRLRGRSYQGLPLAYESTTAEEDTAGSTPTVIEGHFGTARTYDSEKRQ